MPRSDAFLFAYLRQWWHERRTGHDQRRRRNDRTGRVDLLACWDCDLVFWRRA
jgi:hypothetical protein